MRRQLALACLARVRLLRGEVEQAVAAQRRAIELSDPPQQRSLRESLDDYLRAAQPRR